MLVGVYLKSGSCSLSPSSGLVTGVMRMAEMKNTTVFLLQTLTWPHIGLFVLASVLALGGRKRRILLSFLVPKPNKFFFDSSIPLPVWVKGGTKGGAHPEDQ